MLFKKKKEITECRDFFMFGLLTDAIVALLDHMFGLLTDAIVALLDHMFGLLTDAIVALLDHNMRITRHATAPYTKPKISENHPPQFQRRVKALSFHSRSWINGCCK